MIIRKLNQNKLENLKNEVSSIYYSSEYVLDMIDCQDSLTIEEIEDAIQDLEDLGVDLEYNNIVDEFDTLDPLSYDLKNNMLEVEHAVNVAEGQEAKHLIKVFEAYISILKGEN